MIDKTRQFPHLASAPIVEAVIHLQARASTEWESSELQRRLKELLPDYPHHEPQHQVELAFETDFAEASKPSVTRHRQTWYGTRVRSATEPYIAQFNRDGLVFSRLPPYEDWDRFSAEAIRLWRVFAEIAAPLEIQRLGVRFINRISSAGFQNLGDYLKEPPTFASNLELNGFFYQSGFLVPRHSLGINLIKTMQPASGQSAPVGLIVDIDVFTTRSLSCDDCALIDSLSEMRWFKNMVFFDLLTQGAIDSFR
jgi:uncharacterized protein (TIGR04255 family)